jgi:lipoprotein-releasing system ATP-binding protein
MENYATSTIERPQAAGTSGEPMVRLCGVTKNHQTARGELRLFEGLDLEIGAGELVAVVGQSGSGKSTLLHLLGALDRPSSGRIYCASTLVTELNARDAARFRNEQIGYVWQFHYLLPEFSAQENVAMPLMARGVSRIEAMTEASRWLSRVGLEDRATHRPGEMSGGEQQRVALARALVTKPKLLLADEPTGDLDAATAEMVFGWIEELHREQGLTSLLVTHNLELAGRCARVLRLERGRLVEASPKLRHA